MLFTYLEHTRKQSEETRKRKAFMFTVIVTGIIISFYLLTVYFKVVGTRPTENEREAQKEPSMESRFNASNAFLEESASIEKDRTQKEDSPNQNSLF